MASGRVLHKAVYSNPEVAELTMPQRWFYAALIVHSDDDGRMRANPKHLKALIFPFDFELRAETISEWLFALQNVGLISLYSVDGKDYLYHPNWKKWQTIRSDRYKTSDCPPFEAGKPLVYQRGHNLTLPNLTQPNKEQQASPALQAAFKAVSTEGLNPYALIGKYKKETKLREPIPDKVLIGVCESFLREKPSINKHWPWFVRVLQAETEKYFSERNEAEGEALKAELKKENPVLSMAEIMRGMK